MKTPELTLENINIRKGNFWLRGISFQISKGEYFILLGPTGSGKTLLLETIAGLHRPAKGKIWLGNREITHLPPEKRGLGFVYQDYALFPHLTVAENVAFGLALQNQGGLTAINPWLWKRKLHDLANGAQVAEILRLLGIAHLAARSPRNLSGGERQRAALARALIIQPRALLLDEPLSALDPNARANLRRELKRLQQRLNLTILHVTHDFEEALALASRIGVLHQGKLEQIGTPDEVFRRPRSEFVAKFVGMRNIFSAAARELQKPQSVVLEMPSGLEIRAITPSRGEVRFAIRPEDIIVAPCSTTNPDVFSNTSLRNRFCGEVVDIEMSPALVYITVQVPAPRGQTRFTAAITHHSWESLALRLGKAVEIGFKASAVHVW